MMITIDLKTDTIEVEINIDDLDHLSMKKDFYIKTFKKQA